MRFVRRNVAADSQKCHTYLSFIPPALTFESRPKLSLARDSACLSGAIQGTPDSSRSPPHSCCKCLFSLADVHPNLISARGFHPARQPQRSEHHFMAGKS